MVPNKSVFTVLSLFLLALTIPAAEPVVLPELVRPAILIVREGKAYVLESTSILIYDLKNYRLIRKFGQAGEGPGEFKVNPTGGKPMSMTLYHDQILVNSLAKMSYFDLEGNFLREQRVTADALLFPIGEKFIAIGPVFTEPGKEYLGFSLMDKDEQNKKVLYRSELNLGNIRELVLPMITFTYNPVYRDRIYINTSISEFLIDVFDAGGKKLYSIRKDYDPIPTSKNYLQECLDWFRVSPRFKREFELVKQILRARDHFPPIRDLQVVENNIHVLTYGRQGDLWECIRMDLQGKELGRTFIPLDKYIPFTFYPVLYSVYQGKVYTLVENIEEECWELKETELK